MPRHKVRMFTLIDGAAAISTIAGGVTTIGVTAATGRRMSTTLPVGRGGRSAAVGRERALGLVLGMTAAAAATAAARSRSCVRPATA